ncbi:MAG: hypothetical protein L7U87_00075 [Chlamydiales bacterium]|nr:hypothetical protein [Chlamydiales bacterium]
MNDMYEILFDNIDSSKINYVVKQFTGSGSRIVKLSLPEIGPEKCFSGQEGLLVLDDMFKQSESVVFFSIHLDFLVAYGVRLSNPVLSIVRGKEECSLIILFYEDDIIMGKSGSATPHLIEFSKEVAEMLKAESYCAGLEPAEDEATRIFTGDVPGPYTL